MQNGFQFCPTVVVPFNTKNVTSILPVDSIFFPPLFQFYLNSVTEYFSVHISRDRQGDGDEVFSTSWCSGWFLLEDSLQVRVAVGLQ